MGKEQRREDQYIMKNGLIYLNDLSLSVSKRIANLRIFLREYYEEKERVNREQFRIINGFDATDDDAKRAVVDELFLVVFQRYPKDDHERNDYTYSPITNMMRIGWRPT